MSLLQRVILMTHTMAVILPWSHWEVYLLTFLRRRGAVFLVKGGPSHPCGRVTPHGPWQKRKANLTISYINLSILP
jgi:hypothetical protein